MIGIMTIPLISGHNHRTFRQRPDSVRSNNPTHSVSAIGPRAAELTADHGKYGLRPCMYGDGAFAEASPGSVLRLECTLLLTLASISRSIPRPDYIQCLLIEWGLQQAPAQKRESLLSRVSRWQSIVEYYSDTQAGRTPKQLMWPGFSFKEMGEHLAELAWCASAR